MGYFFLNVDPPYSAILFLATQRRNVLIKIFVIFLTGTAAAKSPVQSLSITIAKPEQTEDTDCKCCFSSYLVYFFLFYWLNIRTNNTLSIFLNGST
jgi:hypothetical protein